MQKYEENVLNTKIYIDLPECILFKYKKYQYIFLIYQNIYPRYFFNIPEYIFFLTKKDLTY